VLRFQNDAKTTAILEHALEAATPGTSPVIHKLRLQDGDIYGQVDNDTDADTFLCELSTLEDRIEEVVLETGTSLQDTQWLLSTVRIKLTTIT